MKSLTFTKWIFKFSGLTRILGLFAWGLAFSISTSVANAAIVMSTLPGQDSYVYLQSSASGNFSSENTGQVGIRPFINYYANTLSTAGVSQVYSWGCYCYVIDPSLNTNSTSSVVASADVVNGILHAAGSYSTSGMSSVGNAQGFMSFITDTPYAYTLDMFVSAGTNGNAYTSNFDSEVYWVATPTPQHWGTMLGNGFDIHQTGLLQPGLHYLGSSIQGGVGNLLGSPSGGFDYTLVLTPIPEPETYAMLMVGLGLIGAATRRRKQTEA